jgi:hypothetical protein
LRPKPAPAEAVRSSAKTAGGEKSPDAAQLPIYMSIVIVTGAAGLIGSENVKWSAREGFQGGHPPETHQACLTH